MAAFGGKESKLFNTKKQGVRIFKVGLGKNATDYYYNEMAKYKNKYEGTSKGKNIQFDNFVYPTSLDEKGNTRICHLIQGISGSGKSRYAANFICPMYKDIDPNGEIFLICPKAQDIAFDSKVDLNIHRLELNDSNFVDANKLVPEDFIKQCDDNGNELPNADSCLVIFDDIEGIHDKKVQLGVYKLMNTILTNGRSKNIHIVIICHNMMHRDFITAKNECHFITVYPMCLNHKIMEEFLHKGLGFYKPTRDLIYGIKAQHLTIHPRTGVFLTPTSVHKIENTKRK